jgi:hypothetical protein
MNTSINEIFSNIDEAAADSEACVLESMLMSYLKTYDMLTNEEGPTIVQEAVEADAKSKKKDNVFVKILDSIIAFFKKMAKAVSSFFSKAKETIVERLRKFSKPNNAPEEVVKEVQEKADKISDKKSESLDKFVKPEFVEDTKESKTESKEEKKSKKTGVVVKERKIKTRIKFQNWIRWMTGVNANLDNLINSKIRVEKLKFKDKNISLYHVFSHKYPASDVADYIEEIVKLLKELNLKFDKASTKLDEIRKYYSNTTKAINTSNDVSWVFKKDPERVNMERSINDAAKTIGTAFVIVQNMTAELAEELGIYGIILDTVEPVLSKYKAEAEAKAAAEEAKKKADAREERTQHVEVHVKKDDE